MQTERHSIWIITSLFLLAGLWRLNLEISWGWWSPNSIFDFQWWIVALDLVRQALMDSPGMCAVISALVYAYLHYRGRHLTLWLMALQMMILLLVSFYPIAKSIFVLLAWMVLVSVISRSQQKKKRELHDDLLDDL